MDLQDTNAGRSQPDTSHLEKALNPDSLNLPQETMADKIAKLAEEMKKAMEHAEDWERKKTSIPGIFLVKMPKELRVMLLFNPPDDAGNPRKKKGLFFDDAETIEAARKAFPDSRLDDLLLAVQNLNASVGRKPPEDADVFQV